MLFDFHQKQNTKRSGTVHATYLISGSRPTGLTTQTNRMNSQDGDDTLMHSDTLMSSSAEQTNGTQGENVITVKSIVLAKEEDLEGRCVCHISGYKSKSYIL
jgi:DNA polymerase delta subunit 3